MIYIIKKECGQNMKYIITFIKKHPKLFNYFFCLIISLIALLITSKNSILYQFNEWVDANAFFTVGKSMMNGLVPYKDLFEQKGPLLYLIYGIGYLISHNTFHGVFILETIFFSVFLYWCSKCITLFLPRKYCYVILPIYTFAITTASSFIHGGSAEELCLPFLAITLYYFLKHFEIKELSLKELFICGICAGLVLLIKYNILGFWIGFMFVIELYYLLHKNFKKIIFTTLFFLLGMLLPFSVSLIYFGINHAINQFLYVYFYININLYSGIYYFSLFRKLENFVFLFVINGGIGYIILSIYIFIKKINFKKYTELGILIMYLSTIIFIFCGKISFKYYILPTFIFILVLFIKILLLLQKWFNTQKIESIIALSILILPIGCYFFANYRNDLYKTKNDFPQYKYAEIINSKDDPTLVNMGSYDAGLYTISGLLPTTYFFQTQVNGFKYDEFPDNIDAFDNYIDTEKTMFILYNTRSSISDVKIMHENLFVHYDLIEADTYYTEGLKYNMFLFMRKESTNIQSPNIS